MNYEIQLKQFPLTDEAFDEVLALSTRVFGRSDEEYLRWRIENMPDFTLFLATYSKKLVGFKAGYAATHSRYYSWLGGVDGDFRHKGIASKLMEKQHSWLKESRYSLVETHVHQDNTEMIKLNLKYGYKITGMFLKSDGPNYIMQLKIGLNN